MSKKKNQKPAKTVSSQQTTVEQSMSSVSKVRRGTMDTLKELELARIGHRENEEWKQSNDDRQWW